ncbi:MAG TPA: hypothetical protein PKZ54_10375 [Syntrophorhabdaceae bacterium]|nr:hypothetical protein [Syntrophorhabdaceae bacterium]
MADKDYDFKEGIFYHISKTISWDSLKHEIESLHNWDDGYLAFSNVEKRIKDLNDLEVDGLLGRINGIVSDAEGYLMEAGLWRAKYDQYEEIYIEREDDRFFIERWQLKKKVMQEDATDAQGYLCFFREAAPLIYGPTLKKGIFLEEELGALEIVVPNARLHIFISVKKG